MPTTKEFERYPGKKRREEGDDDATAGDNPPHAGGDDTPASGAVARLQTAFAGAGLEDRPAPLEPAAQPTPTVGVVPTEPETTPREPRANAEPTPAQPPAAARALRRSPRASPATTPGQPPAAARGPSVPGDALADAATAPALLDDGETWESWSADSQKVAALERLCEMLKATTRAVPAFREPLENCGFRCGPDTGGSELNVWPPQHLPPIIDVLDDQYSWARYEGRLASRPQLVAYLEGVLKRVADSKSDDDAMESAPVEQEAVSSRLERARQDHIAAAAKLRASLGFGQALDIRYPATVAAAGSLSSGDDVGGTSASVGPDAPRLVVMGHGFSAAQDAYRKEHAISEEIVFFNMNCWSAAPQHHLEATIRLINATPKQSATLSFTLCDSNGAAVNSPFGLDVLGASDCVVTSEMDAVVCYRILDGARGATATRRGPPGRRRSCRGPLWRLLTRRRASGAPRLRVRRWRWPRRRRPPRPLPRGSS